MYVYRLYMYRLFYFFPYKELNTSYVVILSRSWLLKLLKKLSVENSKEYHNYISKIKILFVEFGYFRLMLKKLLYLIFTIFLI